MLQLFYQVFVALALVSGIAADVKCITENEPFGGHGGKHFQDYVTRDTNITGIIIRSDERLDAIGIKVDNVEWGLHGGGGGDLKKYKLNGKKITKMEVHRVSHHLKMKVSYVKFTVDDGFSIEGGSEKVYLNTDKKTFKAPVEGAYLIGFKGKSGKGVDSLAGVWLDPKCAKKLKEGSKDAPKRKRGKGYDDDDDDNDAKDKDAKDKDAKDKDDDEGVYETNNGYQY